MADPFAFTPYDPALAAQVCHAISDGMTLAEACEVEGMPRAGDVLRWAEEDAEFAAGLAAAQRFSARIMLERLASAVSHCPEELQPATFPQWVSYQRLRFAIQRLLFSIYDPDTFGRIRGPRISTYREPPPKPQPAAVDPVIAAEAQVERAAFRDQCAARGVKDDLAAILLNIAEDDGVLDTSEPDENGHVDTAGSPAHGVIAFPPTAAQPTRLSRHHRRAMAAQARKAPAARATSPPI
jgi:hypothetical protein